MDVLCFDAMQSFTDRREALYVLTAYHGCEQSSQNVGDIFTKHPQLVQMRTIADCKTLCRGHSSHWLRGAGQARLDLVCVLLPTCKLRHTRNLLARHCVSPSYKLRAALDPLPCHCRPPHLPHTP
jgi:hypothetical protein